MKMISLLAGVAAVALSATSALAGPAINQGSATGNVNVNVLGFNLNLSGTTTNTGLLDVADGLQNFGLLPGSVALFTINSSGFANNTASTSTTNGATFSLKGNVTPDCAYYFGSANTTVDFGQIGINTSDNNPDAAFEMVNSSRTLDINSNLAGCNTRNTVTFSKTDLSTTNGAGFDPAQFTNVIPVKLVAKYTAGVVGGTSAVSENTVTLATAGNQASASSHGAWKSSLDMKLTLTNPGKGLLAGDYTGSVGVTIVAN